MFYFLYLSFLHRHLKKSKRVFNDFSSIGVILISTLLCLRFLIFER